MIRHRKALVYVAACALATFAAAAGAENTQQTKMTTCNADAKAKHLAGGDRKTFMKTCLSAAGSTATTTAAPAAAAATTTAATTAAAPAATKLNSQQQKMKTCNADAKTQALTGAARKTFMSNCLKGS